MNDATPDELSAMHYTKTGCSRLGCTLPFAHSWRAHGAPAPARTTTATEGEMRAIANARRIVANHTGDSLLAAIADLCDCYDCRDYRAKETR